MKKKIFITGEVREYETENAKDFYKGIEDYIKDNLVPADSADNVTVSTFENATNDLTITFKFGTGKHIEKGMISREMKTNGRLDFCLWCFSMEYGMAQK